MASDREETAAEAGAAPRTREGAEQAAALDKVTDQVGGGAVVAHDQMGHSYGGLLARPIPQPLP